MRQILQLPGNQSGGCSESVSHVSPCILRCTASADTQGQQSSCFEKETAVCNAYGMPRRTFFYNTHNSCAHAVTSLCSRPVIAAEKGSLAQMCTPVISQDAVALVSEHSATNPVVGPYQGTSNQLVYGDNV